MLDRVLKDNNPSVKKEYTLSFNKDKLEFEMAPGEKVQGRFKVITDDKGKPEGYVLSDDLRMNIITPYFGGLNREIGYVFDSTGLKEGVDVSGTISIVSNLGEYEMPYTVHIISTVLGSELGEIRNLFHFANLAKSDYDAAVKLFYSDSFERLLTGNDRAYLNYYKALSTLAVLDDGSIEEYNESNVDVFLELIKKKNRSKYSVNKKEISIKDPDETVVLELQIKRDGWGYTKLDISADCDFIFFDNETIISEDFTDNIATLNVYINHNELHRGRNTGNIIISNIYQTIEIPVKVSVKLEKRKNLEDRRRRDNLHITRLYTNFRLGAMSKTEWIRECSVTITRMISDNPDDLEARLYHAHILIIQKRDNEAKAELNAILEYISDDSPSTLKGYFIYLQYLLTKNEEKKQELSKEIELLYVQESTNFRLAWLLMCSSEDYKKNDKEKWRLLKKQYEFGCVSPLLFIEALTVMITTPGLMTQLGDFELALLAFVKKRDTMTGELRNRLTYLASKEIGFSRELFDLLTYSYDRNPNDETLVQICQLLMKGNLFGPDYFKWYEKAVDNELRISKLYEYYIMSIDMNYNSRLPKIVLLYFAYRSNLDFERNAFLYANVLRHKPAYQDIYYDYLPVIEEFAINCLKNHRLNDNLAFIYQTVLGDKLMEPDYVRSYAYLCFVYSIKTDYELIDSVIVINENLVDEQHYPIYNGEALIPIVGDRYSICLEDIYGNRYADPSMYELRRIITNENKLDDIMRLCGTELYSTLYLAEKCDERAVITETVEDSLLYISSCDAVLESFRLSIMINLAEYYFDKDEIAKLDELLLRFDPSTLDGKNRETCIRIMVARGMYDRALDWVKDYGIEYVDDKILVRLCDRILVRSDFEYEPEVLKMCESIFNDNRYDETILKYLILYKQGTSMSLKRIWRAADSFNIDAHDLLEKIMIQLMYSGVTIGEESNIFLEYIENVTMPEVEKAFLNKLSYDYFAKDAKIDVSVFDRVIYLHQIGENVSDYCKIAFLKGCDSLIKKKQNLSSEHKALIVLFVKEFNNRHMLFPFFLGFKNLWPKLSLYDDRCFIEYKGSEDSRVMLHYCIETSDQKPDQYIKEEMHHYLGGVFVASFILFYGEKIKYYITEEGPRSEKLTKSSVLEAPDIIRQNDDSRYAMINNIAISKLKNDEKAYESMMENYIKKCYVVDRLFLPDRGEI